MGLEVEARASLGGDAVGVARRAGADGAARAVLLRLVCPTVADGGRARVTHFVRARAQDDKRGKSEPRGWMYLGDITSVSNEGDIIVIEHPTRYGARPPRRRERAARA